MASVRIFKSPSLAIVVLTSLLIVIVIIISISQLGLLTSYGIQAQTNTGSRPITNNVSILKDYSLLFDRTLDNFVGFHDITIRYPDLLNYSLVNSKQIDFVPTNNNDSYLEQNAKVSVYLFEDPYPGLSLEEIVSEFISSDRSVNLKDFELLDLKRIELEGDLPAYKLVYNYLDGNLPMQAMYVVTLVDDTKNYDFVYSAEKSSFSKYLGIANQMLENLSINAQGSASQMRAVKPAFKTPGNIPDGLSLSPNKEILYVTNFGSGSLSSINLKSNLIKSMDVGVRPTAVTPPIDNVVFVSNFGSHTVSAIDTWTNKKLADIPVGKGPISITADTDQIDRFVFVPNEASDSVSIIYGRNMTLYKTVSVGNQPNGIAVNPIMNRAYTANHGNGSISVLDYLSTSPQREVKIAPELNDIAVDPINNILFVTSGSGGLYIINGSNYHTLSIINLVRPTDIDIDPEQQTVFVTSPAIQGVYSYDYKRDEIDAIQLGYIPAGIVVDSINHRVFVSGGRTNEIQVINETSKNLMMRMEFKVNDTQGTLRCNDNEITNNTFHFYDVYSSLNCKSEPKTGFSFSSWSGSEVPEEDYKNTNIVLNLTENGSLSPHFVRTDDPLLSVLREQYEAVASSLLVGLILGPLAGWFVGYAYGRLEKKRQLKYLKIYLQLIDETYQKFQKDKEECIKFLEEKRSEIMALLKGGIINDSTFGILKDRIGEHFSNLAK